MPSSRQLDLPLVDRPADPQQRGLVHVEVDVHRVDRHDRGQQRLVLVDQVAEGQVVAADLAVDRRGDLGELVAELVDLHALLVRLDPRIGLVDGRLLLVELLLADRAGRQRVDGPVAGQGRLGQLERGLVEVDLALGLVELGLVGPGIDDEQQVPCLDLRPFLERHLDQVAGDSGADVDRLDGLGPAGEVDVVGDLPPDGWLTGTTGGSAGATLVDWPGNPQPRPTMSE